MNSFLKARLAALAEKATVDSGVHAGHAIEAALKKSFSDSVTAIYRDAVPLVVLAFLLMLMVKELPLKRSNMPPPSTEVGA